MFLIRYLLELLPLTEAILTDIQNICSVGKKIEKKTRPSAY